MDSDLWAELSALLFLIVLIAVTCAALAAWPRLNRGRLKHLAGEGDPRAASVLRLVETPGSVLAATGAASLASTALAAGLCVVIWGRYFSGNSLFGVLSAIVALSLLLGLHSASQTVGQRHPESTAFFLLWPLQAIDLAMRPFVPGLRAVGRLVVRGDAHLMVDGAYHADEDLRMIVDAVEEDGALEEGEREMIHSIFEMGETTAREIMVPRVDVVAVASSASLQSVLDVVKEKGFSRIPVFEGSIDNIVGIAYAKDLLLHMEAGSLDVPARVLARAPHFIPESKKIDELLREMQSRKVHMAVVLDEYGGTAGIVTIEDLLEEIVGEIQDEYDREEIPIERVSESEAVLNGRVSIRDLNEALDVSLEDGEYDTVGGLVYDRLGKIPVAGDEVRVEGLSLTVISTVGKRIKKIRVRHEAVAE